MPIIVVLLIFAGCKLLTYMLYDDTDFRTRLMMHEFYEQENIDILFTGTSHCAGGINPFILDEKTEKNTFLACSPNQWLDVSYALLKEADDLNHIDEVFVEISANIARKAGVYKKRESLTSAYIVTDYMRPALNKFRFLLNASSSSHYINSFWPARRYWENIADFQKIDTILQKKSTSKYQSYSPYYVNAGLEGIGEYLGKGHTSIAINNDEHKFMIRSEYENVDTSAFSRDWMNTLMDIIDYCEKKGIKLTLFAAPLSNFELADKGNYDDFIVYITELINGKNVQYVDFNLIKEEYLPYRQKNYSDGNHLNMYGEETFSRIFADYINGNLPEDAFHTSVKEKLQAAKPDYYGVSYTDDYKEQNRVFHLVSNIPAYFEYQVEITTGDGETHLLQEFDTNNIIAVSFEMIPECVFHVTYRPAGSSDEGTLIDYPYMEAVY